MDLLQFIGSIGGITGVLAFLMFLVYRQDHKTSQDNLTKIIENMESRQTEIVRAYNETCQLHTNAMVKNTQVLTELIVWLKARNGHG
jgi:hypothetical protein